MEGADLLKRVANVCDYYRGANWALHYDSEAGGYWSLRLTSPAEPEQQSDPVPTPFGFSIQTGTPDYPIFAMRCQELGVIAEAIEHWHSSVLSRDVPGQ